MADGIAYMHNLIRVLAQNNMPMPTGVVLSEKMFEDIRHAYPAIVNPDGGWARFRAIQVYREKV